MKILLALLLSLAPMGLHASRAFQPQAMGGTLVDRDDDGRAALRVSPTAGGFAVTCPTCPGGTGATTGTSITAITGAAATSYFDKLTTSAAAGATAANQATELTYLQNLTGTATANSDFALNAVSFASSVAGTSFQYLTLTAKSYLMLGNDNTVPLYFVITNSATAPTTTSTIRRSIPPGGQAFSMVAPGGLEMGKNFLHWFWPASSSATLTPTAHLSY